MCATKVAFPGFDSPAAGFEAPLEMLSARLLGDAQLDVVGRAMRLRRGIKDIY